MKDADHRNFRRRAKILQKTAGNRRLGSVLFCFGYILLKTCSKPGNVQHIDLLSGSGIHGVDPSTNAHPIVYICLWFGAHVVKSELKIRCVAHAEKSQNSYLM